jgi:alkanesulfonate monooxygenase SsuD/methylene tetrahydromethanopterin reductase-like flavin-dependent oxidoreductase (luciferase family)
VDLTSYSWSDGRSAALIAAVEAAQAAGVDAVWVADHPLQAGPASQEHEAKLEACTAPAVDRLGEV